jgi:hypothetical protein
MKIIILSTICLLLLTNINCQGKDPRGFIRTPKAYDLDDHFGTEPASDFYGPGAHADTKEPSIAREYDSVDGPKYSLPIKNFSQEIKQEDVVHGDLTNTAYDATKIIKVPYANPKAEIDTEFVHDAVISTPVQLGNKTSSKLVTSQNRQTGVLQEKRIEETKPIVGIVKNLRQVRTNHKTFLDIHTGKVINTQHPTMLHGTN